MNYGLLKDIIDLVEQYELENSKTNEITVKGFRKWIAYNLKENGVEPDWEGKEAGRSPEVSLIRL